MLNDKVITGQQFQFTSSNHAETNEKSTLTTLKMQTYHH